MGRWANIGQWLKPFFVGATAAPLAADARDPVAERRDLLNKANLGIDEVLKPGDLAIAFSGGGIRSATISLGVAQSLVQEERLLDFDYCSTVSGGGYFGSFLTSLFVPDWARGPNATAIAPDPAGETDALLAKKKVAFDALGEKRAR